MSMSVWTLHCSIFTGTITDCKNTPTVSNTQPTLTIRRRIDSGYFLCRPERNPAVPWSAMDFGYFGLAQIPEALLDVDMGEGVTIQELEDAGWVF